MPFRALLFATALVAYANADIMLMYTNTPPNDPLHSHCQDLKANMSDDWAQQWWAANAWNYAASQGWKNGSLCDTSVYPVVEHQESPIGVHSVVLRRLGHSSLVETMAPEDIVRNMVGDNHCTELVVPLSKNSSLCITDQWWSDNKWRYKDWNTGHCAKPYTTLDRTEHPVGVDCVDVDTYGVTVSELTEDNEAVMIMHNIAPGGAHCTELYWEGGKNNPYWKEHGYQYPPSIWEPNKCDHTKYNWFNRNGTIAEGVTSKTWGVHQ